MEKLNHNDTIEIVLLKLELSIRERQEVELIIEDESYESYDDMIIHLNREIGQEKSELLINWLKENAN